MHVDDHLLYIYIFLECIDAKWGKGAWNKNYDKLRISGNQKCLDQVKLIKSSGTTKQAHADL